VKLHHVAVIAGSQENHVRSSYNSFMHFLLRTGFSIRCNRDQRRISRSSSGYETHACT